MNLFELLGAFFACYGALWLVFALAPVHEIRKRKEYSIQSDLRYTKALNQQLAWKARRKMAA